MRIHRTEAIMLTISETTILRGPAITPSLSGRSRGKVFPEAASFSGDSSRHTAGFNSLFWGGIGTATGTRTSYK